MQKYSLSNHIVFPRFDVPDIKFVAEKDIGYTFYRWALADFLLDQSKESTRAILNSWFSTDEIATIEREKNRLFDIP